MISSALLGHDVVSAHRDQPSWTPAPAPGHNPAPTPLADHRAVRILVADGTRSSREGIATVLQHEGYSVTQATRANEALAVMAARRFDIVLVDLSLAPGSDLDFLRSLSAAAPASLTIVLAGEPSVDANLSALEAGAWDYLPKPFPAAQLVVMVGRAARLAAQRIHAREGEPRADSRGDGKYKLIGDSPAFRTALQLARRVAATNASVMLVGESGTGKELFAQLIHRSGPRAGRAFVPVNCAALPEALLESELFGHRKGAFTGADREKAGLLEAANGGTFFLDELTEMPLPLQAKLLRVLQDGVVRRVGSEQDQLTLDTRFISATNRDPAAAVRQGTLRHDLFYRLHVVPIRLPSLRQRPEDIPLLARHFFERAWRRNHGPLESAPPLSGELVRVLVARRWAGNVRELENAMEYLAVLATPGRPVDASELPPPGDETVHARPLSIGGDLEGSDLLDGSYHTGRERLIAHYERAYLTRLLDRAGNMSKAARQAGIDRTTLYRLVERHKLGASRGISREALVDVGEE